MEVCGQPDNLFTVHQQKKPWNPLNSRLGLAPELVSTHQGFEPWTVQPTHCLALLAYKYSCFEGSPCLHSDALKPVSIFSCSRVTHHRENFKSHIVTTVGPRKSICPMLCPVSYGWIYTKTSHFIYTFYYQN